MRRIGVTGHTDLTRATRRLVFEGLLTHLRRRSDQPFRGVTCLADGADQLFAEAVLALDGRLDVILPARDYRAVAVGCENLARFDGLLRRATEVIELPIAESTREAFAAANDELVRRSHELIAVWDGRADPRIGGTHHAVRSAERAGVTVTRLWPENGRRRRRSRPADSPTLARSQAWLTAPT